MPDVIVAEGLTRRFGGRVAVDGLSVRVAAGEVFGLLGPNGAGKTTTIRMLACLIGVTAGRATVAGLDVTDPRQAAKIRALVGVLPEEAGLYGDLTAAATLDFFARLYRMPAPRRAARVEALLVRLGLWDRRDEPVATWSKGLKQRLALARALVHDPQVVLLDEPTANLDPQAAATVRDVLRELVAAGRAVVVNTHRLEEAERMCDRVAILRTRLLQVGTPAELRARIGGVRLVVDLDPVRGMEVDVIRRLGIESVTLAGSRLEIIPPTGGPTVPAVVEALVSAGARIAGVAQTSESLEDAYLSIIDQPARQS